MQSSTEEGEYNFNPDPDVTYDIEWLEQNAKNINDRLQAAHNALDEKADSIIKHLGGGLALASFAMVGVKLNSSHLTFVFLVYSLPAVVLAVTAIVFCLTARWPRPGLMILPIDKAARAFETFGVHARFHLLRPQHRANELLSSAIQRKTSLVKWAMLCFASACCLMILPLVAIGLAGHLYVQDNVAASAATTPPALSVSPNEQ